MQSGSIEVILSREQAGELNPIKNWMALAKALNCSSSSGSTNSTSHLTNLRILSCMKRVPATKLRTAISKANLVFGPNIDNKTFYADTLVRLDSGKFANVPVLVGSKLSFSTIFSKSLNITLQAMIKKPSETPSKLSNVPEKASPVQPLEAPADIRKSPQLGFIDILGTLLRALVVHRLARIMEVR